MEAVEYMWPFLKCSCPPQAICRKVAAACYLCSPLCILTDPAGCSALALSGAGRLLELFKQAIKLHRPFKISEVVTLTQPAASMKGKFLRFKKVFLNWCLSWKGTMQELSACQAEWRTWIKIVFPAMNKTDTWMDQTGGMWTHIY